ncbi:FAD-dependent monooxygenase [Sphingobacterium sp. DR205]|uniref:FAD-dependent monooxygenase n=1 Tax=Sphingobacterium sp. DR205 TaxID=2713573 RepID=UPI0013E46617|nr:FAD-dependent monooxygenase [Sphingobacterium sp. DR205]QIH36311.1 monooxygenase [Sphingobacterium sp. DR205]
MKPADNTFIIIGGGIAGLCTAIGLQQLGIEAHVYESVSELKGIGAGFGLAANAMQALDHLGLKEEISQIGHYLESYNVLDQKGNILVEPDTRSISKKYKQDNFAIHRADLHQFLLSKIPDSQVHLGKRALSFDQLGEQIHVHFTDGTQAVGNAILVADGVHSLLRQHLIPTSTPRYSGYTCWRATIDNSSIQLKKSTETWGAKGRFGMTPLVGDRIYWYACINSPQQNPALKNWTPSDLLNNFKDYHDPIPTILSETQATELIWNDIIDIAPLQQLAFDNILLLGDAGHATTPNLGQGACQAIEDVAVLLDELKTAASVQQAFARFEARRLDRVNYISNTSWQIGKIAQWENPFLIGMRNFIMKIMPNRLKQQQLNKLLSVDFMQINRNHES